MMNDDRTLCLALNVQLRLVRSHPRSQEFNDTFSASHAVYHKYQVAVHHDPPSKPSEKQYTGFLVDSPLIEVPCFAYSNVFLCIVWQVKLVSDLSESYGDSHAVFKKYQMTVHNESASDCTDSDFDNFLVHSPLCGTSVCWICFFVLCMICVAV